MLKGYFMTMHWLKSESMENQRCFKDEVLSLMFYVLLTLHNPSKQ